MDNLATDLRKKTVRQSSNIRLCSLCKSEMAEMERLTENGFVFIWYECQTPGCDGQWLEKRLAI